VVQAIHRFQGELDISTNLKRVQAEQIRLRSPSHKSIEPSLWLLHRYLHNRNTVSRGVQNLFDETTQDVADPLHLALKHKPLKPLLCFTAVLNRGETLLDGVLGQVGEVVYREFLHDDTTPGINGLYTHVEYSGGFFAGVTFCQ